MGNRKGKGVNPQPLHTLTSYSYAPHSLVPTLCVGTRGNGEPGKIGPGGFGWAVISYFRGYSKASSKRAGRNGIRHERRVCGQLRVYQGKQ